MVRVEMFGDEVREVRWRRFGQEGRDREEMLDVVMEKMEMVSETVEEEDDQLTEEGGRRTFRRREKLRGCEILFFKADNNLNKMFICDNSADN